MSNTKISTVLRQLSQAFKAQASTQIFKLGLVSGNQSGDADSIISSITYCFLHFKQSNSISSSNKVLYLPYLNFARSELRLRKDVLHVFQQHEITEDLLMFSDDLDSIISKDERFEDVILVDHNVPQGALANFMTANEGTLQISGIIDHHVDEGQFLNVEPRIIEKSGSCVSLVYQYFKTLETTISKDSQLLNFVINPVLLDTSNMQSRVEQAELDLFQDFQKTFTIISHEADGSSTKKLYESLIAAKNDITGLTFTDLLNKDYKNFSSLHDGTYHFGISSIGVPLEYIMTTYTFEEVTQNVVQFIKDNGIEFLAVMTAFVKPGTEDEFHRQLAFFNLPDKTEGEHIISEIRTPLSLERFEFNSAYLQNTVVIGDTWNDVSTKENVLLFEQHHLASSRKQVAPLLREKVCSSK
ncbi:hypothetical protein WICPIJ_000313 [Wickerhamomyces pijperi]|uniref:DHHA2 domain-containing protein n=1 Tax=Wickerhamomyces pijperi TaxID=599730 RepID=A0A9P8TQZ1_WICPI|nr:hypothetical protein WICPIJ_000313 [Wickerhamomyces pijperi]